MLVNLGTKEEEIVLFFKGMREDLPWQMACDPTLWQTSSLLTSAYCRVSSFSYQTAVLRFLFSFVCFTIAPPFCLVNYFQPLFRSTHLGKVKSWARAHSCPGNCLYCFAVTAPTASGNLTQHILGASRSICL